MPGGSASLPAESRPRQVAPELQVLGGQVLGGLGGPGRPAVTAPLHSAQVSERLSQPGVAIGLAWSPLGGEIMFVEASRMDGEGQLTLTGQLGDVMKESAHLAISWLRSNAKKYHLTNGEWRGVAAAAGGRALCEPERAPAGPPREASDHGRD